MPCPFVHVECFLISPSFACLTCPRNPLPPLQVALRKILKKHDKVTGGQRGRAFLQYCWRLPSGGAFLHSPLLDELQAIQVGADEKCWVLGSSRALGAVRALGEVGQRAG